jgi:CelD/BcsL family acetyltransferase involved in cellulose biosynthesis
LTLASPTLNLVSREASLQDVFTAKDPFPPADVLASVDPKIDGFLVRSAPVASPSSAPDNGWYQHQQRTFDRFYCDLACGWDAYLARFSKKALYNLKRNVRRLSEATDAKVEFLDFQRPDEIQVFCRIAEVVSTKTYQARLYGSRFPADSNHEAAVIAAARSDRSRGHVLRFGERPVAYAYFTVAGDTLQLEYLGYDPEVAKWSVGMALLWTCIERYYRLGLCRFIDFGEGDAEYKRLLSTGSVLCANRFLVRKRARSIMVLGAQSVSVDASRRVVGVLDRIGAKAKLRGMLRRAGRRDTK